MRRPQQRPESTVAGVAPSARDGVCARGVCAQISLGCVAPLVECGGFCVDLSSDPNNCGGVWRRLPGRCLCGRDLLRGPRRYRLRPPHRHVWRFVRGPQQRPEYCGACGTVCASGVCEGGTCFSVHRNIGASLTHRHSGRPPQDARAKGSILRELTSVVRETCRSGDADREVITAASAAARVFTSVSAPRMRATGPNTASVLSSLTARGGQEGADPRQPVA